MISKKLEIAMPDMASLSNFLYLLSNEKLLVFSSENLGLELSLLWKMVFLLLKAFWNV